MQAKQSKTSKKRTGEQAGVFKEDEQEQEIQSSSKSHKERKVDQEKSVDNHNKQEGKSSQAPKKQKEHDLGVKNKLQLNLDSKPKMTSRIILWLRNDLRIHDNYIMNYAINFKGPKEIIPVYCFDPAIYHQQSPKTKYGTHKTGIIRSNFRLQTVQNLKKNLNAINSDLIIAQEAAHKFIPKMFDKNANNIVVYQQEICFEELRDEERLKLSMEEMAKKDKGLSVSLEAIWGSTLYNLNDLDFNPKEYLPHIYGKFREKNQSVRVRNLLPTPQKNQMPFMKLKNQWNKIPSLKEFGFTQDQISKKQDPRTCYPFAGGEDNGLKRLEEYIFTNKSVGHYLQTRNELSGSEYSSKLSPWLADGSLSARQVYHKTREYEKKYSGNPSTKTFVDELLWRDFNRYWCMRYKNKVFSSYGIYDREYYDWQTNQDTIQRWRDGNTGMPLVDALMREMNETGFMPNRGRMIVACYLTMDLKQDWRYGAHHFEEKLIDHDVHSNYGGWSFSSGIGPGRVLVFNSLKQSRDFDKSGEYIKTWCPELKSVPVEHIHEPFNMPVAIQKQCGVIINKDYPKAIECLKYTNPVAAKKEKAQRKEERLGFQEKKKPQQKKLQFKVAKKSKGKQDSDEESSAKDLDDDDDDGKISLKSDENISDFSGSIKIQPITSRQKRNAKMNQEAQKMVEESREAVEQLELEEIKEKTIKYSQDKSKVDAMKAALEKFQKRKSKE